jgi:hypothetical protein
VKFNSQQIKHLMTKYEKELITRKDLQQKNCNKNNKGENQIIGEIIK